MKKITLFMLALIMTFGAMAQFTMEQKIMQNNIESNVVVLNKNLSLNNLSNATFVKNVNGTKTVGATITGVTIGALADSGIPVSFTVTPNADCASYLVAVAPTGIIEAIAVANNVTAEYVMQNVGLTAQTGTQTLTAAVGTGDSTTIYVLAIAADQTTSLVKSDNFVTPNHGGTGTANVIATAFDVTHTTVGVSFTLNDQADYFYYGLFKASVLTQYSLTTDSIRVYLEDNADRNYLSVAPEDGLSYGSLVDNTEYVLFAFAYNQNDVLGTATAPIHFTTGTNGLNDVATISTSIYPNPAKDVVNLTSSSKIERVEMFNMMGQKVSEKSVNANSTSVNVVNLNAGTYVVKVYTNAGVATKKIVVE